MIESKYLYVFMGSFILQEKLCCGEKIIND